MHYCINAHHVVSRAALMILFSVMLCTTSAVGQSVSSEGPWPTYGTENGEWRSYAGDIAGTKYSSLDQITAENFSELEIQWEWTSVDRMVSRTTPEGGEWYAPLNAIVDSLVADTPNLYRESPPPNGSRLQATP